MNQNQTRAEKSYGKYWTVSLFPPEFPAKLKIFFRKVLLYLRPPRALRFTRFGSYTVLMSLGLGLAAMNTGNNLLYMIFGMLLGFIAASGVLSEMSLRGLEAEWILPSESYAGKESKLRIILKNNKETLPSMGVSLSAKCSGKTLNAHFDFLPGLSQDCRDISFLPKKRGKFAIEELRIETRFPFSFFRKYAAIPSPESILVYPDLRPVKKEALLALSEDEKSRIIPFKGRGESYWGMKEFASGDNPRQISWKASARQARLMVWETEKETEKKIVLSMEPMDGWSALNETDLEKAVSFAASFAWEIFQEGFSLGFDSPGLVLPPSEEKKNILKIFQYLALFNPGEHSATALRKNLPGISIMDLYGAYA